MLTTFKDSKPGATCEHCNLQRDSFLCHLSPAAQRAFTSIKRSSRYPAGSVLFLENEPAQGVFLVCSGKVKLSVASKGGKTLILQIVQPGEIIGLSASMSGTPHEVTAEALHPVQGVFISRQDFLQFIQDFPEASSAVMRQFNLQYRRACEQLRVIGLSGTAQEKLARLFLHWSSPRSPGDEQQAVEANQIRVPLTHEQIAGCLGSTRETVTRTLSDFKSKHLITLKGTTVMIPDRSALMAVSGE